MENLEKVSRGPTIEWTDENIATMKKLYEDRVSYSLIAAELGRTPKSVTAKLKRLGLTGSHRMPLIRKPRIDAAPTPTPKMPKRAKVKAEKQPNLKPESPREVPIPETFRYLAFMDLEKNDCRFPSGDAPILFCGAPRKPDCPYCAFHAAIAFPKRPAPLTVDQRKNLDLQFKPRVGAF